MKNSRYRIEDVGYSRPYMQLTKTKSKKKTKPEAEYIVRNEIGKYLNDELKWTSDLSIAKIFSKADIVAALNILLDRKQESYDKIEIIRVEA